MIASGSDDKTVRLWDVSQSGKESVMSFTAHTGMINSVRFHPDSTCLASCSTDGTIKIFDCRSQRLLQHYAAHDDAVNSINFNSAGTHLISTSNDTSIKIWDLRKGAILYTLFGHQGATTSAAWSPLGDYFVTGGADAALLAWQSNINNTQQEDLSEIKAKIETEVFVTEKEKVDKLPETRGTKMGKPKQKKNPATEALLEDQEEILDSVSVVAEQVNATKNLVNGMTYRKLRPEAKRTLEKIVYQLELCGKTLQMLESRVAKSEDKLYDVLNWIKHNDIEYVSSF